MTAELVICGIPFGTEHEAAALAQVKELGFTAVQIYTFWRDIEPVAEGAFDWSVYDPQVRAIQQAGLKYVPFILMGPKYAAPDWWLADPRHAGLRCLEHGKDCPIESIWSPAFRDQISRVLAAFAEHYLPWQVLESVQPGICGDYGEAIYPALGNWPGDYHTHRGFWCGADDAVASFQAWLRARYGSIAALNATWRSSHADFSAIRPFLKQRASSRSAWFDLVTWYQGSMTAYSAFWMAECRRCFPDIPAYLCTGGADDEVAVGAHFASQAKIAAQHGGGLRLTNEVNTFDENLRLVAHTQSACEFYGAYIGLEPVGPLTEEGVRARMFGSAAFGNRQMFHYFGNITSGREAFTLRPAAQVVREHAALLGERPAERGIGLFWPVDQALLEGALPAAAREALVHIRRQYPVTPLSEEMILDGALAGFDSLLMIGVSSTRAEALRRIATWVREDGGLLLAVDRCCDLELEPVAEFDALFGLDLASEDAWGHSSNEIAVVDGFPRLSALGRFHIEHGWLGLAAGTECLAIGKDQPAQSNTRRFANSALFRRCHGKGQAIFYCGPVTFRVDPQACFGDPGVFMALLDDICALSGVAPFGTRDDEIARARIDGALYALTAMDIRRVEN